MANVSGQINNLEREISIINGEISQVERENSRLKSEINNMVGAIKQAKTDVVNLYDYSKNSIDRGVEDLNSDDKILKDVNDIQDAIKTMHAEYKGMEKAYKTIRKLTGELKILDENNQNVNRTMIALMDFLRGGIISKETIFKNVEMLHPMTKNYYLSYIMVAVASWIMDKKENAQKAVECAMELDKRKSAIFFFIFWTKQGRYGVAKEWLKVLMQVGLTNEDESLLFLIVLFSLDVGTKDCGSDFLTEIKNFLDNIWNDSRSEETHSIIDKISQWLSSFVGATTLVFNHLSGHIEEYDTLMNTLTQCKANENILQALIDITTPSSTKVNEHYIDAMLEEFIVDSKSIVGQEIADSISLQEEIINLRGKEFEAMQAAADKKVHCLEKINIKENMYKWLHITESFEGERKVNVYAYNNLRNLYTTAYTRFYSDYSGQKLREITIKSQHYSVKTTFDDIDVEIKNINTKMEEKKNIEVRASRRLWRFILFPFLALIFLVLASVFVKNVYFAPTGFCLFAINVCATLVAAYHNKANKAKIEEKYSKQAYETKEMVTLLFADYQRYNATYEKYDAVSKKIYLLLSTPRKLD